MSLNSNYPETVSQKTEEKKPEIREELNSGNDGGSIWKWLLPLLLILLAGWFFWKQINKKNSDAVADNVKTIHPLR